MSILRAALLGILVVAGSPPARANDPAEDLGAVESAGGKLVGVWRLTKSADLPPGADARIEFTRDGKVKLSASIGGTEIKATGTYAIAGNKLKVGMNFDGKVHEETMTIKELSATRFVTIDPKGKVDEFRRK